MSGVKILRYRRIALISVVLFPLLVFSTPITVGSGGVIVGLGPNVVNIDALEAECKTNCNRIYVNAPGSLRHNMESGCQDACWWMSYKIAQSYRGKIVRIE